MYKRQVIRYNASLRAARKLEGNLKGFWKASKKKIKKLLTNTTSCDKINELLLRTNNNEP